MTTPRSSADLNLSAIATQLGNSTVAPIGDPRALRLGLLQDEGRDKLLWMGLPYWAPTGVGIPAATYTSTEAPTNRTLQMLPVEGMLQFIEPRVASQDTQLIVTGAVDDDDLILGSFRTGILMGGAAVRVAWHEDYATHGGPYGLRAAALDIDLSLPWVYWQMQPTTDNPSAGRIISAFQAYVAEASIIETRDGKVGDFTLRLESRVFTPRLTTMANPVGASQAGEVLLVDRPDWVDRRPDRGGD